MIAPIPPVIKPLAKAPTAPNIETILRMIARSRAQLLPRKNPIPVASQVMLKPRRLMPMTNPRLLRRAPILGSAETTEGSPIITTLAVRPMSPKMISRIARIVIPAGL